MADNKKRTSFYALDKQLLDDAGRLSFNNATGNIIGDEYGYDKAGGNEAIPGIMTINYEPCVGLSRGPKSPLNVAAKRLYTYVVHMNSRPGSYDATDLMQVIASTDSIYEVIFMAVRVYGLLCVYNQRNKYLAKALITACGFDYDDIVAHVSDFRSAINIAIAKTGIIAMPKTLKFVVNHMDLVQNVFLDENSIKGQFYLWVPASYYVYNEANAKNVHNFFSYIDTADFSQDPTGLLTVAAWQTLFDSVFDPISSSETANLMFGDILKAYGDGALIKLPLVPDNYVTPILDDYYMKQRIHNSMGILREMGSTQTFVPGSLDLIQNSTKEWLLWDPQYYWSSITMFVNTSTPTVLLDLGDVTTPDLVMEATRGLTYAQSASNTPSTPAGLTDCGTEVVYNYWIYYYDATGLQSSALYTWVSLDGTSGGFVSNITQKSADISMATKFNYAPRFFLTIWTTTFKDLRLFWSVDNYTTIDNSTLFKLNQCALLSLFNVPLSGSWTE